jgi:Ni,Fe-hydrogenase maturation factor
LKSLAVHQLTPELVPLVAAAERVIFVDARADNVEADGTIAASSLTPSTPEDITGHLSDPRAMLALARVFYGCYPRAWLITVPAVDLSLGEGISPTAKRGAESALGWVRNLLGVDLQRAPSSQHQDLK